MFPAASANADSLPGEGEGGVHVHGDGNGSGNGNANGRGSALQALERQESASTVPSRMPSVDLERGSILNGSGSGGGRSGEGAGAVTTMPFFEPLGADDVFDVFDLELAVAPGGKEAGIDARYRSSDSGSGRPTYKIQKKTKAHFLGKKNMSVEVTRSLGWDPTTAAPTLNGSKGYVSVFSGKDQPSRSVALTATNSVLCKSAFGGIVAVSNVCGAYNPAHAARQSGAHHFFALKLNEMGVAPPTPARPSPGTKSRTAAPHPPLPAARPGPPLYEGGGHFVFDSAPRGRTDLLTTLYCTGYEQRPGARAGDVVVAELRVRPAADARGAAPPWARFFKERHAALHVARRGLDACMTGAHVRMRLAPGAAGEAAAAEGVDAGALRAVLARGQALEVVLAALATAVLAIEHDGGLVGKRWAWLVQQEHPQLGPQQKLQQGQGQGQGQRPRPGALPGLGPAPAVADDPGLMSPDAEGDAHSEDDSQGPASASTLGGAFDRAALFAGATPGPKYSPSVAGDGRSVAGSVGSGIEMDEWIAGQEREAGAGARAAPPPPLNGGGGTWARKGSAASEPRHHVHHPHHHHHRLNAGSWPEKNGKRQSGAGFERMQTLGIGMEQHVAVANVPEPKSPTYTSARSVPWPEARGEEEYAFS